MKSTNETEIYGEIIALKKTSNCLRLVIITRTCIVYFSSRLIEIKADSNSAQW